MTAALLDRPAIASFRRLAVLPAAALAGLAATTLVLPVVCPFRLCTGHACPGCGLTRGVGALAKGDLALSWRFHPLAVLIVAQLAIASLILARAPGVGVSEFLTRHVRWVYANVALLIVVWIVRWRFGLLDLVLDRV